jgi:hypothetical protein
MEGLTGIEPALSAWEAEVLPLNYSPVSTSLSSIAGRADIRETRARQAVASPLRSTPASGRASTASSMPSKALVAVAKATRLCGS